MIIGRFNEGEDGNLIGHIRTMFFKSDKVVFEPVPPGKSAALPAFRIYSADEIELGAAWRKAARGTGLVYYEVTLDDPTFTAPIRCRLAQAKQGGGFLLVWERARTKTKAA